MADIEVFRADSRKVKESKAEDELNTAINPVRGIKIKSPNGTVYHLTVADDGTVITSEVTA